MTKWSKWIELADKDSWRPKNLVFYEGAACYELGIRGKRRRIVKPVYVGHTDNLHNRMYTYAHNGSHLRKLLLKYWMHDYKLYFKYYPKRNKATAKRMEEENLKQYGLERYPWNTRLGDL